MEQMVVVFDESNNFIPFSRIGNSRDKQAVRDRISKSERQSHVIGKQGDNRLLVHLCEVEDAILVQEDSTSLLS